ncbi:hypothetical protein FLONG3_2609 [Fusarium longipes]|uniref:RING-type domain-containing protein n=1 Tax=Fusarium longipes TaxID=694270 RepID=A0A395T3I8_9HYPO|nr:hypothetical protein FLONG3_2609 [Fusarium longipes]
MDSQSHAGPITSIYWPWLKLLLEEDSDNVRELELACPICTEPMSTCSSRQEKPPHEARTPCEKLPHEARILPCGHMLGRSCLEKHVKKWKSDHPNTRFNRRRHRHAQKYYPCPICEARLYHHWQCGHDLASRCIPPRNKYSEFPPVLSEGGSQTPGRCTKCTIDDAISDVECQGRSFAKDLGLVHVNALIQITKDRSRPGLGLAYRLFDAAKVEIQYAVPEAIVMETFRTLPDLEIPSDVMSVWECYKKLWQMQNAKFWFSIDMSELELVMSVVDIST